VESLAARLAGSGGRTRPRSNFGHLGAGNHALAPIWFTLLGEAYLTAGQLAEALSSQITPPPPRRRGSSSSTPAASARGRARPRQRRRTAEDEALFRRAIEIGRAQEAKAFGLRAAAGLARLWRDQGKAAGARDLVDATALLDELRL